MSGPRNRICIAILALGGQGGGVLANWIADLGRANGYIAQSTSVPGVAQRTGSTVYYVELARKDAAEPPIMAQMPIPGDVDIVLASELIETGRAVLRGFSTADRTVLIGSTHRIYAISEKMVRGDGTASDDRILAAAAEKSKRFIGFDMEAATERSGSVISSILFGALAGSGALPFSRDEFLATIAATGIAVEANNRGFEEGFAAAQRGSEGLQEKADEPAAPIPTSAGGKRLAARIANLPEAAQEFATTGAARTMEYQDEDYASLYLERLENLAAHDAAPFDLTRDGARHLALWMTYEDTIRVADLKVRASRFKRVRDEVRAEDAQIVHLEEFMHPRLQEVAETMPGWLGRWLTSSAIAKRLLSPFFSKGRHVRTSSVGGFAMLYILSRGRRFRRSTMRYVEEQARIEAWLSKALRAARAGDHALAAEIVRCQRLIKGYGDTFERSLKAFDDVMTVLDADLDTHAEALREKREAVLARTD